jgi:hypothetical protein
MATSQPGAGPQWPKDATNLNAPDDSAGGGGVSPAAIRAGHEPDSFYVKPIFAIPLAVVVTFVIAFLVALGFFLYFMDVPSDPRANPAAAKANDAPANERLARIDRKGSDGNPNVKADNPRLEPLRQLEGNGQTITRPPLPDGYNSPELHPEEINPALRPESVPALAKSGKQPDGTVHIPITDAMTKATGARRSEVLPSRKEPVNPTTSDMRPTGANSGRARSPGEPEPKKEEPKKAEPKKAGPKQAEPKKDEPNKNEPKKGESKKGAP